MWLNNSSSFWSWWVYKKKRCKLLERLFFSLSLSRSFVRSFREWLMINKKWERKRERARARERERKRRNRRKENLPVEKRGRNSLIGREIFSSTNEECLTIGVLQHLSVIFSWVKREDFPKRKRHARRRSVSSLSSLLHKYHLLFSSSLSLLLL